MNPLPISVALPRFKNDMTIARAHMATSGTLPTTKGLDDSIITEMKMCFIEHLIECNRDLEAEQAIEDFIYDDERMQQLPEPYAAWLWLARMTLLIDGGNPSLSLGAAENALQHAGQAGIQIDLRAALGGAGLVVGVGVFVAGVAVAVVAGASAST